MHPYLKFAPLVIALAIGGTEVHAQQPALRPVYDRTDDCRECHERVPVNHDFVNDIPGRLWDKEDKHRRAFALLQENKPVVTKITGFDWDEVLQNGELSTKPADQERVERVKQCLRCHATWPKNDPAWSEDRPGPPVDLKFGVSCQACHGPGLNWSRPHRESWWRLCTPTAKRRLGLNDLRHPVRRALLCASCHVGSLEEGKFVTHAMYAAGHPPLPTFEFTAFATQMPRHWRSLQEKGDFRGRDGVPPDFDTGADLRQNFGIRDEDVKDSYRSANFPHLDHDPFSDLSATQGTLISGLVVMRDYLKLLNEGFASSGAGAAPEFALFDCTACHHELRSTRVARPSRSGPPGRPPLQAWPTTLARAGLWQLAEDASQGQSLLEEFDRQWLAIERAATQRPFGDRAAVRAATDQMTPWLEAKIVQISRQPFHQSAAKRTWDFLTDPNQIATQDYHAARQTAWALKALAPDAGYADAPQKLFSPEQQDRLQLTLPATQSGDVMKNLRGALSAVAEYDPVWFESVLRQLQKK